MRRMDREYYPYAAVPIPPCGMVKKPLLTHHACLIHGRGVVHGCLAIARYRAIGLRADLVLLQDLTAILLRPSLHALLPPVKPEGRSGREIRFLV